MKITPENLISNIDNLGGWSRYGLASIAIRHYFPEEYSKNKYTSVRREYELADKMGCKYWEDVIIKYHNEIGYTAQILSNKDYVNEY